MISAGGIRGESPEVVRLRGLNVNSMRSSCYAALPLRIAALIFALLTAGAVRQNYTDV